jgi:hypothetical protein
VPRRDELFSRLFSAAEPRQTNTTDICLFDLVDVSTTIDDPCLHTNMLLNRNDTSNNDTLFEIDEKRIEILSDHMNDWIEDTTFEESDSMSPPVQNVCLPDFIPMSNELEHATTTRTADLNTNVLSGLDQQLNELGLSRSEFYSKLRHNNANCSTDLRAHFDCGSMASTTDKLHYLWYFRSFESNEHPQALQVADHNRHRPTGTGFLRIPILQRAEQTTCLVRCLYTPTLPATIVSPFDLGIQYRCNGYSCESKFSGAECTV